MESPFINKVKKIMEDPNNAEIICWAANKTHIEILNQKIFQEKVLAPNFRHQKITSFIRQLNLYGFKKIRCAKNKVFTHILLQKGLGLEAITNRKKNNCEKNEENQNFEQSLSMKELNNNKTVFNRKEIQYQKPIDFFSNHQQKQMEKEQQISTPLTQTMMSPIWIMPLQQNIWQMPFLSSPEEVLFNLNNLAMW